MKGLGLNLRIWGAIAGFLAGVLILWPHFGWRLLVLAVIIILGYLCGRYFELKPELRTRLRELFANLFR